MFFDTFRHHQMETFLQKKNGDDKNTVTAISVLMTYF